MSDETTPETTPVSPLAALPWNVLGPAIAVALMLGILIGPGLGRRLAAPASPTPALPTVAAPAALPVEAPAAVPTAAPVPAEVAPTADPTQNYLVPVETTPAPAQAAPARSLPAPAAPAPAELERLPSDLVPLPTATPVCIAVGVCRGAGRP